MKKIICLLSVLFIGLFAFAENYLSFIVDSEYDFHNKTEDTIICADNQNLFGIGIDYSCLKEDGVTYGCSVLINRAYYYSGFSVITFAMKGINFTLAPSYGYSVKNDLLTLQFLIEPISLSYSTFSEYKTSYGASDYFNDTPNVLSLKTGFTSNCLYGNWEHFRIGLGCTVRLNWLEKINNNDATFTLTPDCSTFLKVVYIF